MDRPAMEALLAERRVMLFCANRGGKEPFVTPVWYEYCDGRIFITTGLDNAKVRLVQRNPAVTLCVQREDWPYRAVLIRGRAEVHPGRDAALLRRLSHRYLGRDAGDAYADFNLVNTTESDGATLVVTPSAWRAWDYAGDWHDAGTWTADAGLHGAASE